MGFRNLPKPREASTNPKTPLACKITKPRRPRLILLLNGSPQGLEPGQTLAGCLFHVKDKRILSRRRRTSKGLDPASYSCCRTF